VIPAPIPEQEEQRLQAVHALHLLDTPAEERFDRLSRMAARMFGTSAAFVSLIDRDRQLFKSRVGLDVSETPRDISLCAHAILGNDVLVVPDTRLDVRFADNPLVTGEPFLRFYAGQPLRAPSGDKVGTLCIADQTPRDLSPDEREILRELGELVEKELRMTDTIALQEELIGSQRELIRVQERVSRELGEAAKYVEASLPPPIDAPLEIRWVYLPSGSLGGDGFGYAELTPGRYAIYLLDVCGHGVASALLAVVVLNALRARSLTGVDFAQPAEVLAALNAAFPMSKHGNRFFTLWYGVLEIATGQLTYASGGHPPAFAIDRRTGAVTRLTGQGIAVGCVATADYEQLTHRLAPEETLYLYSDGAFEIRQGRGAMYSLAQFERALVETAQQDLQLETVVAELQKFRGPGSFKDDIAIMTARLPS
jgi:sigma-B regulation protein RsbU (phosphoserine phosphatase)